MDHVDTLKIFVAVVECNSFSAAARRLRLQPSSVSRRIAELEARLSARLFNRSTRSLVLTEAGEIYFEKVKAALGEIEDAENALANLHRTPSGTLRITAPGRYGWYKIAPLIPEFIERYPDIRLELSTTDRFVDILKDEFDLAIRITALYDSAHFATKISDDPRVLVATPAYIEKYGHPNSIDSLSQHRLLVYKFDALKPSWKFRRRGEVEELPVEGIVYSGDGEFLLRCINAGMGIGVQPFWRVAEELRNGTLVAVLDDFEVTTSKFDTAIYAIFPHKTNMPPKTRAFIDFLKAKVRD